MEECTTENRRLIDKMYSFWLDSNNGELSLLFRFQLLDNCVLFISQDDNTWFSLCFGLRNMEYKSSVKSSSMAGPGRMSPVLKEESGRV